jgi:hypothetical protein
LQFLLVVCLDQFLKRGVWSMAGHDVLLLSFYSTQCDIAQLCAERCAPSLRFIMGQV